jgi:hypothetical protein
MREGRSPQQLGRTGTSNQRWMRGVKLAYVVNQHGRVVAWDCAPAKVYDAVFHPLIGDLQDDMVVFTDMGVHAQAGDPPHMQPCARHTWKMRMVVETVLAMLPRVCQLKKITKAPLALRVRAAPFSHGRVQSAGAMGPPPGR